MVHDQEFRIQNLKLRVGGDRPSVGGVGGVRREERPEPRLLCPCRVKKVPLNKINHLKDVEEICLKIAQAKAIIWPWRS